MSNSTKKSVITLTNESFKNFLLLMYGKTKETGSDSLNEHDFDRLNVWDSLLRIAMHKILEKGGAISGFKHVNGNFEKVEASQFNHWPSNCMWVIQLSADGQQKMML